MTFFAWLCSLDKTDLVQLITARPETGLVGGPPQDRAHLATRLLKEPAVKAHFQLASQPVHAVVELLATSGGQSTIEAMAKTFDLAADDRDLAAAVNWLTTRALAWPDAQGLHLVRTLKKLVPRPYGLGSPAHGLLDMYTANVLKALAARWGLRPPKTKAQLVAAMADWLGEPDNVRQLLRTAPEIVQTEIERVAWDGPITPSKREPAVNWALQHGLVFTEQYWSAAEMPSEVGRALRGPGWRPTFLPRPPMPAMAVVAPGVVARESAAAAAIALEQVGAMIAECASNPVPALKTGGIGPRELRRLAKVVGCDEQRIRLWLELGYEASLLDLVGEQPDSQRLLATPHYDDWLAEAPAVRLEALLHAWRQLPAEPYASIDIRGPVLIDLDHTNRLPAVARQELLTAASRLPAGQGLVADDGLAPVVGWQMPSLRVEPFALASMWQEATALGIVAHGALTTLGRALAANDAEQLAAAAGNLVGAPTTSAIFQADLTAVVPGIPDHALTTLLDSAADRESRGGALIWRFTSASVRRALDSGGTADELTAQLIAASGGLTIPQPLAYLIGDIGRQHGQVRVRDVGCVIHGVEETLLAEILAASVLRGLGLTRLAPTVLASASPQAETLAALRAAGYFPAAEQPDGTPPPRAVQQRAKPVPQPPGHGPVPVGAAVFDAYADQIDPYDIAEQLFTTPPGRDPQIPDILAGFPTTLNDQGRLRYGSSGSGDDDSYQQAPDKHAVWHRLIEEHADRIDPESACTLATALEFSEPVRVSHRPNAARAMKHTMIDPEGVQIGLLSGRDAKSGGPVLVPLRDIEWVEPL